MPKYVGFLRAINVLGRRVEMAELRRLFAALGFASVETFIASGNVIFESSSCEREALQKQIEDHLLECLGYPVVTFLRTLEEVAAIAQYEQLPEGEVEFARAINVAFLAEPLSAEAAGKLEELRSEIDRFQTREREVYWLCDKESESRFSNAAFERKLGVAATFRSIRTVARLAARYPPRESRGC